MVNLIQYAPATAAAGLGLLSLGVCCESENSSEVAITAAYLRAAYEAQSTPLNDDRDSLNAIRLMKAKPSFPHLLVLPPQDNPELVATSLLDGGTRIPFEDIFPSTLAAPPFLSLRHGWVAFLRRLRALQYKLEAGLDDAAYRSRIEDHQRDIFTRALHDAGEFDEAMTFYVDVERSILHDLEPWKQQRLQAWVQELCGAQLAHVVWKTTPIELIQQYIVDASQADVCLLVRPQRGRFDPSSAQDKLAILSSQHSLELTDEEQACIIASVGNSWSDLHRLCTLVALQPDTSVQESCDALALETDLALRAYLHLDKNLLAGPRTVQEAAIERWTALQRICNLGSDLELLAGPQALMKRPKRRDGTDIASVLSVFAASGAVGDRRFWDLLTSEWAHLHNESDVTIGVVPCAPVEICRGFSITTRPLVEASFRRLWVDDAKWQQMHDLQSLLDEHDLHDQLDDYDAEIADAAAALNAKRRQLNLAWEAYSDTEQAEHNANIHLDELKLQLQREHVARLRLVYNKRTTQTESP
ncbi:Aste57867_20395 [Aphanomyces stellatus]|uniref:Aste57867_20395 protein n=1 Tax=Aphanomyces stellatus TaxID=120398 RepID=A0A485LF02_9STRA|nr:hypothetical protein As57867_020329 [Aphanomyces stellatus]VFT97081.1 Aste57867_20395 [Aphanomyces stellatus]